MGAAITIANDEAVEERKVEKVVTGLSDLTKAHELIIKIKDTAVRQAILSLVHLVKSRSKSGSAIEFL